MLLADPSGPLNFRPLPLGAAGRPLLYRTGTVAQLSIEHARALHEVCRIRAFVDLRSEDEIARYGPPQALMHVGVEWVPVPIQGYSGHAIRAPRAGPDAYADYYFEMLTQSLVGLIEALRATERCLPDPVLFGCHAGKDRTGVLAAILLELCGVSRQLIREDYARTATSLDGRLGHFEDKRRRKNEPVAVFQARFACPPETMDIWFGRVEEACGGLVQCLDEGGAPAKLRQRLRRKAMCP